MAAKEKESKRTYPDLVGDISKLLETARKESARTINALLTATYWVIGYRIVEFEYQGREREEYYGEKLLRRLSSELTLKFGKGFSRQNLQQMIQFYNMYKRPKISQTLSGISLNNHDIGALASTKQYENESLLLELANYFKLPWSAYVRLLSVKDNEARKFYEEEALRNGWSVRQLDRQISSQFYERTLLSKNKADMIKKGEQKQAKDLLSPEEEIKDPYILEFLGLKDEYSESDLEEALIKHLESFLLELGSDFAFIGRQKRLRIGNEWYRIDLLFFHRKLKCLVVIDLKVGKFSHTDAGQMHMYLNYAKENWTNKGENPPVGLILCAEKDSAVAKYSLEGLPNKVLAAEYKLKLPDEQLLINELNKTRKMIAERNRNSD
ncbi:MAG: DUF1016 domain-containing protein [Chlorobi bacterium]|nr:DUF1016 domain-containing protein [Chlorobiota bacterium]